MLCVLCVVRCALCVVRCALCVVLCCACMSKRVSHGNSSSLTPPPPTGNYTIWQTFPQKEYHNTIWQTYPRKKSHGRTSPGEKQYHNYGKVSPSMVDPPHTFIDKGTNTMADCPPGNNTIWQTFHMKEYLMANLPPEEIP